MTEKGLKLYICAAAFVLTLSGCTKIDNLTVNADHIPITSDTAETEETSAAELTTENAESVSSTTETEITEKNWALFVVNDENPLPDNFSIITKPIYKQRELDIRCADYAIQMIEAALYDGIELNVTSGYRSTEKQQENIEFYIENYMTLGYSFEEAEALTYKEVARPGCSEHNAGVAMDIVTQDWFMYYTELTTDFEYTEEFDWLQENSWKYGFIMSFPEGKEDITGFSYEPWHYRFVGVEHAEKINSLKITLNEYIEMINA